MNPTLQRAVTSFYNLIYEAQTFETRCLGLTPQSRNITRDGLKG